MFVGSFLRSVECWNSAVMAADNDLGKLKSNGIRGIRLYECPIKFQPVLELVKKHGLRLYPGYSVDARSLVKHWRSQIRIDPLKQILSNRIEVEAYAVGNEFREALAELEAAKCLARVLVELKNIQVNEMPARVSITTTFEQSDILPDSSGGEIHGALLPIIEECDCLSVNVFPMLEWYGSRGIKAMNKFYRDVEFKKRWFEAYESILRRLATEGKKLGKPVIIAETSLSSVIGMRGARVQHVSSAQYSEAYNEMLRILASVARSFPGVIRSVYLFEWKDWEAPKSHPWHLDRGLGLHYRTGGPKINLRDLRVLHES